jgi:hypothetical protein
MLRSRIIILLGGCLLAASAAWADDVGYIDCRNHPDETQVFGKARQTHEAVAALACGERFTILLYGFIFSRIQTRDGKVGYVYSNVISVDRSGASVQRPPSTTAPVVQPNAATPTQVQPTPAQPVQTQTPAATSNVPSLPASVVQANPSTSTQAQPTAAQPGPAQVATSSVSETRATVVQPSPTTLTQPEPPSAPPAETQPHGPTSNAPEVTAADVAPASSPAAQPEPAPAEPAAPAIRAASARESWERPNAGGRRRMPLIELFGGYGFARMDGGGGTATNLNGALGSFGWNVTPWLQIVADSSYSVVTVGATKNVLYGNHWGPRVFRRGRNRWGLTPFVEALAGSSRSDVTVSGTGGYKYSENAFSFKVGGGLDIKPSRRFEIRLFDVDYYRTSFGLNLHQNNYSASTGIVLRLFGGSE